MYSTEAVAKKISKGKYEKITIQRGWTSEDDVDIDVIYCGFCHTDVHFANNDWGITDYPVVPGHEVAGVVTKVGSNVTDIQVGDHAGVGYFIDSCLNCEYCKDDDEINCLNQVTRTSTGKLLHGRVKNGNGSYSYGR